MWVGLPALAMVLAWLAWCGWMYWGWRTEQQALERVDKSVAVYTEDEPLDFGPLNRLLSGRWSVYRCRVTRLIVGEPFPATSPLDKSGPRPWVDLGPWPYIESLELNGRHIDVQRQVAELRKTPRCIMLEVSLELNDHDFDHVGAGASLVQVLLGVRHVSPTAIASLKDCPRLKDLSIGIGDDDGTDLDDAGVAQCHFERLSPLDSLDIFTQRRLSASSLELVVAGQPQLERLRIDADCSATGFKALERMPRLRTLSLYGSFTKEDLEAFRKSRPDVDATVENR